MLMPQRLPRASVRRRSIICLHHAANGPEQPPSGSFGRESSPEGPRRPRVGEVVDEPAFAVLCQALGGPPAGGSIANRPFHLAPPMGGDLGVGVQGKPVDAGTAGTGECW